MGVKVSRMQVWQALFLEAQGAELVLLVAFKYLIISHQVEYWEELVEYIDGCMTYAVPIFLAWGATTTPDLMSAYKRGWIGWSTRYNWKGWRVWYALLIWLPVSLFKEAFDPPYRFSRDDDHRRNGHVRY
jgi:hypothetical protein